MTNFLSVEAPPGRVYTLSPNNEGPFKTTVVTATGGGATLVNLSNVLYVDKGTTVAAANQIGNIEAPFATISAGVAALAATGGTLKIAPGDYSGEPNLVVSLAGGVNFQNLAAEQGGPRADIRPDQQVLLPRLLGNSDKLIQGCVVNKAADGPSGSSGQFFLRNCDIYGQIGCVDFQASNCYWEDGANVQTTGEVIIDSCDIASDVPLVAHVPQYVSITNTDIDSTPVIAFTAPGGLVHLDAYTASAWIAAGGTVNNGRVVVAAALQQAVISVVVPAIIAAGVAYVDVSTVGTDLQGIQIGVPIIACPSADLAAAGAGGGAFVNARVSALDTIRCAFLGILAGGATDFTFAASQ